MKASTYFDADETFFRMWNAMGKNINWAESSEGQALLEKIKKTGSSPSFGTGDLITRFKEDLLVGKDRVRGQVANMYDQWFNRGGAQESTKAKVRQPTKPSTPQPKSQPPAARPQTKAQDFSSKKIEQLKNAVKSKKPSVDNTVIKNAMKGISGKPTPPPTTKQLLQGITPKGPVNPIAVKPAVSPAAAQTAARVGLGGLAAGITTQGVVNTGARLLGGNVVSLTALEGSTPQGADNWRALGYPSREAYIERVGTAETPDPLISIMPMEWDEVPIIGGLFRGPEAQEASAIKNNLTKLEDGSLRTGGGDVYSSDGSRYTNSSGITYDLATGRAVNPATNEIAEDGYSIDPRSNERFDYVEEETDGDSQPTVSKAERLARERETLGLTPMQQWAKANKGLAGKVREGQSGYKEIEAYFAAQDSGPVGENLPGRTPKDMLAIREGGRYWDSTMGRNSSAPIPNDLMEQTGTSMTGSDERQTISTPYSDIYSSIALPGTSKGLSQIDLTSGQIQMPDSAQKINVDAFYGAGNNAADDLEIKRFLPFSGIEYKPELNRITNIIKR